MKSIVFENELWDFLRTITECMLNDFRPIAEEHGLTLMQTRMLVEIMEGDHHTVGSLGSIIGLSSGNASSMCKKLEKSGFLKRIRNPEDERYVQLDLTEVGRDTIQKIGDALEQKYGTFLDSKNESEFQTIFACMKKLRSFIQEMSEVDSNK
ncbi:MarR family winged helix-turn-helix transcriptional regulator [Desulfitobacterium sp.]|uniref:MarR family winged helix-turn-helix transcriptional regulator n=1 Tax=Desulfitobacterium sp. TaxID=49981 RepID=UPI002CC30F6F|nr:MarR family transcriptional regulator [Desulfitobacterium sp.]HVJ50095.1 MarR family transcriptional regulator [Desulfitobacterium sp.]